MRSFRDKGSEIIVGLSSKRITCSHARGCNRDINRLLNQTAVSSRDRLRTALDHREPDRIPLDFGSTAVTGIHVSCVAALRDHYGLARGPVKVHEPYQMLGLVEDDLRAAMGLDVTGVFPRGTMFGFPALNWKEWNFRGLDVLVPRDFRTRTEPNGDLLIYPEGDESAPPSGRMPLGSAFFDTIIRQSEIDDERWIPRTTSKSSQRFLRKTWITSSVPCGRRLGAVTAL